MKITIDRSTLLERLTQVIKAVPKQVAVPVLEGVLIESDAKLTLTCSDLHFTITTTLDDYEEHMAGATAIPAKKLHEVIAKMPDAPIGITVSDGVATVKCGSKRVTLPAMDAEEFPGRPVGESQLSISGEGLAKIDSTRYAVSTNEQTPALTGVKLDKSGEMITAIATDRHRLAMQSVNIKGELHDGIWVVPTNLLEAISKLRPDRLGIGLSESQIYVTAGEYHYAASLMQGSYPDTSKIVPTNADRKVYVDRRSLLQTLELAEKIVNEKAKITTLEVLEAELKVTAAYEGSTMEESIEAKVEGDPIKLSANARYLIDALKVIAADKVEIWITGSMSPMILRGEGDDSGLHLVLPYRTV